MTVTTMTTRADYQRMAILGLPSSEWPSASAKAVVLMAIEGGDQDVAYSDDQADVIEAELALHAAALGDRDGVSVTVKRSLLEPGWTRFVVRVEGRTS